MKTGILRLPALWMSLTLAMPAGATQRPDTFTPACADRDLKVITLIEAHGEARDVAPAALGAAGLAHLQARSSCLSGDEAAALAIYDSILRDYARAAYDRE